MTPFPSPHPQALPARGLHADSARHAVFDFAVRRYACQMRANVLNNLGLLSHYQGFGIQTRYYLEEALTICEVSAHQGSRAHH